MNIEIKELIILRWDGAHISFLNLFFQVRILGEVLTERFAMILLKRFYKHIKNIKGLIYRKFRSKKKPQKGFSTKEREAFVKRLKATGIVTMTESGEIDSPKHPNVRTFRRYNGKAK